MSTSSALGLLGLQHKVPQSYRNIVAVQCVHAAGQACGCDVTRGAEPQPRAAQRDGGGGGTVRRGGGGPAAGSLHCQVHIVPDPVERLVSD